MRSTKGAFVCVLVRPGVADPEVVSVRGDVVEYFAALLGGPVEVAIYPRQYVARPGLRLLVDDMGIYHPAAYNRWGIVGPFVVIKENLRGHSLSLTEKDIRAVLADLADTDGGYLDPASGVACAFRDAFAVHGIPPSGAVPQAGCWF